MMMNRNSSRILILSGTPTIMDVLREALPKELCGKMEYASCVNDARRKLSMADYALLIINTPLKDDYGIQPAVEISEQYPIGILLIIKSDLAENINCKVEEFGIVTISKQIDRKSLYMTVKTLMTVQKKLVRMRKETYSIKVKVDEMKVIDRAKWVLIDREKMTETEAHRYIEKEAMNQCVKRVDIAEEIIRSQGRKNR